MIAREVAREQEQAVREVITLGSPGHWRTEIYARRQVLAAQQGVDLNQIEQEAHERNQQRLKQPVTSIYSKSDGDLSLACRAGYIQSAGPEH